MINNQDYISTWQKQLQNGVLEISEDISDLKSLSQVGNITSLTVVKAKQLSLAGIEELQYLKILDVQNCGVSSLAPFAGENQNYVIEELYLQNNFITELKPLERVMTVKRLNLQNNQLNESTNLYFICNMENLQELKLNGNKMIQDEDFEYRLLYATPQNIEFVSYTTDNNDFNVIKDKQEGIKGSLSPFEAWLLKLEIDKMEAENKKTEDEIKRLQKENEDLDAEETALVKGIAEIAEMVKTTFVDEEQIQ
ncbi:Conserved_hypothetical protein [Hexamita inflata]|uniref:Uncharacterized protein n=1 Tax=Hexamita inflata TaxID=28002 RepID=A0AA86NG14_9EUKA|nr:Conserved hypothetical protein [Hexamita inflata]